MHGEIERVRCGEGGERWEGGREREREREGGREGGWEREGEREHSTSEIEYAYIKKNNNRYHFQLLHPPPPPVSTHTHTHHTDAPTSSCSSQLECVVDSVMEV